MGLNHAVGAGRAVAATATLAAATAATMLLGGLPAVAAPPSHDTIAGAKVITALPFSETVDTTEATTDAEDAAINTNCGAPATNGSVWYAITPSEDAFAYLVDVSQSDFTAGVIVATGTPGNLSLVTCGPGAVAFQPTVGTTFYIMAFSDNPAVTGGMLSISVSVTGPPPEVSMVVNEVGQVDKRTGTATLSGTYTCTGEAEFVLLQGSLSQRQGDAHVTGDFFLDGLKCGGTFDWIAQVFPQTGLFERGLAATIAVTIGCNRIGCNFYQTLDTVRLRNAGRN